MEQKLRELTPEEQRQACDDLTLIGRGEEAEGDNLPWRRLRRLLDRGLVVMTKVCPLSGSYLSLEITEKGLAFGVNQGGHTNGGA